jgi:hypothetical protein
LNVVGGILPRLAPLVKASATAVNGLVTEFEAFSKTDSFQRILDSFTKYGPKAITSFGHIAGHVVNGIINLFLKFAPYQDGFLSWIERASAKFSKWSGGASTSKGIGKFLGYVRKVLPDVKDLFASLTTFVGRFITAIGPLAGVELKLVIAFLHGLNSLPKERGDRGH